ncbi:MAG: phosphate acyltransferase [Candidatus Omnitrophica bacterium]|nr:phosphate acyltransferase [Candidatus Omnitrophota bacterium]MDD3987892.1 phosphate acyltransferase [Candidatus Omnitrophota bacterium]
MDTISKIRSMAREQQKSIVLPEYDDKRVIEAARIIESEGIAKVTLLTPEMMDRNNQERYVEEYFNSYKSKEADINAVRKLFEDDTLYYSAMMTNEGKFDGLVAGASHTSSDVIRACLRCIGIDERVTIISSCFIMEVPNCPYGDNGTFIFADCGVIPDPNARQLSRIALSAAQLAQKVLHLTPRVAFLSYSTKGSAKVRSADKIVDALGMLKELDPDIMADGELQLDAAIVPEVAHIKYPNSPLAGKANVLIFPSLEAGNIGYKLTQRMSGARAIGPLLLGVNKPASDLSRGCITEDVVDCTAVTAIRAQ